MVFVSPNHPVGAFFVTRLSLKISVIWDLNDLSIRIDFLTLLTINEKYEPTGLYAGVVYYLKGKLKIYDDETLQKSLSDADYNFLNH